ncbi:MAG TPA: hypothetical protein VF883_25590 [Thermoanaerobaculia bacterium]
MFDLLHQLAGLATRFAGALGDVRTRLARYFGISTESTMASAPSVLDYINTFVTIATFLISERLPVTIENIRAFFEPRGITPPADITTPDALRFVELLVIDEALLEQLTEQTEEGVKSYTKCLKAAATPQQRAACDRRAEKDVCDTLNRIRDRNEDKLPTDYLDKQWRSFGCVRV